LFSILMPIDGFNVPNTLVISLNAVPFDGCPDTLPCLLTGYFPQCKAYSTSNWSQRILPNTDKFREQLSNILENFEILQQVDTANVPPTAQAIPLQNVFREDEVAASLPQSEVLANALRREGDFFRVPAVLE